ncbi:hypothetical protein NECAME_03020 [Necator americanus]|uniref:Mitochondrial carrier protein n=1 Tax=Necator americanus TaxID=51031 RepID=W2TA27_NECAM|nr:hypothetical protein NECAME_03020 [Necator americanus]ETN78061.1 hypothetical protein NECAME_03020 [Necator americanus]
MSAYKGIVDCAMKTVKQETVYGLYKGMWVPFLTTGALHSLLFAGYGMALRVLHPGESNVEARKDLPMSEILIASICGTLAQVIPVIPVELLKTRLQVQRENVSRSSKHSRNLYSGPVDCAKRIVETEGFSGLFKGGKVIFLRDNIGYLFYIPVYEMILRLTRSRNVNETGAQLFAGGCAGVAGWLSVCPLEVVKNRIQVENVACKTTATEVARRIWRHEGASAFYRGGLTMSIRGFIVNAVVFLVYENIFSLIDAASSFKLNTT